MTRSHLVAVIYSLRRVSLVGLPASKAEVKRQLLLTLYSERLPDYYFAGYQLSSNERDHQKKDLRRLSRLRNSLGHYDRSV